MSVLPGDLHPATDPIVAEFGELVEAGPLALLNRVKDAPKRLLDEVKRFEPAALVGDQLGAPYRQLLDQADSFSASQLFAAADAELARARQRLLDTARPSRALEPLRAPVQELFARLDAFSAEALLAPLTEKVEQTIAQIIEASPVDEILGAINGVFDTVRDVLAFAQRIQSVADRVRQLFEAFVTADAAVRCLARRAARQGAGRWKRAGGERAHGVDRRARRGPSRGRPGGVRRGQRGGDRRARWPGLRHAALAHRLGLRPPRDACRGAAGLADEGRGAARPGPLQPHAAAALGPAPPRRRGEERDCLGAGRARRAGRGVDRDGGRIGAARATSTRRRCASSWPPSSRPRCNRCDSCSSRSATSRRLSPEWSRHCRS